VREDGGERGVGRAGGAGEVGAECDEGEGHCNKGSKSASRQVSKLAALRARWQVGTCRFRPLPQESPRRTARIGRSRGIPSGQSGSIGVRRNAYGYIEQRGAWSPAQ
jgi:hypothetical protein